MYHYGFWGFHGLWGFPGIWGFGWIAAIIAIIPFWKICTRVGISPWVSLLWLVPVVGLIFVYYLAFTDWPAVRGGAGPGNDGSTGRGGGGGGTFPPSGPTTPSR